MDSKKYTIRDTILEIFLKGYTTLEVSARYSSG